jgi:hypothetical protein
MADDASLTRAVDIAWSVHRATHSGVDDADRRRCLLQLDQFCLHHLCHLELAPKELTSSTMRTGRYIDRHQLADQPSRPRSSSLVSPYGVDIAGTYPPLKGAASSDSSAPWAIAIAVLKRRVVVT